MLICGIIIFMEIPITQSEAWHILQKDLGEKSIFIKEKNYQFVTIIKPIPMGNYLYCPYGPIAKDKESFKLAIDALKKIATEEKAIFIRVEPFQATEAKYLPKNTVKSQDLNPKETWLLDLQGSEEDLSSKLPSRLLRYYRGAKQKGITIETSHDPADIHFLLELQRALARQKKISTFSEHYLQTELKQPFATLYLAKKDQQVIAAGLVFDDEHTRYNLQGAQSDTGRKLHATGILTIQLIKDAKKKGLKTFDFWGIAPENAGPDHPWAGFTNFKKTFAGKEFDHAGTYDIILNRTKYNLYKVLRKINRILHR